MPTHIDVGIIVAADRLTPPAWDDAEEPMMKCDIGMVTSCGGGPACDGYRSTKLMSSPSWVQRGCKRVIHSLDVEDDCAAIGHNPFRSQLKTAGRWFNKLIPMVWIRCQHARKLHQTKGKGKGRLR